MRLVDFTTLLGTSSLLAPRQPVASNDTHGSEPSPEMLHCDKKCRREYRDRHVLSNAATAANDALENFAAWKECGSQDWCTDAINIIVTKSMVNAVANSSLLEPPGNDLGFAKHVLQVGNVAARNSLLDTYNMLNAMRKNDHEFLKQNWNATKIDTTLSYANYTEWVSGSPHVPLPPLPKPKEGEFYPPQGPEKVLWDAGMLEMETEHPSFNETVFREVLANDTAAELAAASSTTSSGFALPTTISIDSAAAAPSILEVAPGNNFAIGPAASLETISFMLKRETGQGDDDDDDDDNLAALGVLALLPAAPAVYLGAYKGSAKFLNWWNDPSRITGYTKHTISNAAEISAMKTWPDGVKPTNVFDVGKLVREKAPMNMPAYQQFFLDLDLPRNYYRSSIRTDIPGYPIDYTELKATRAAEAAQRGADLAQCIATDCACLNGTVAENFPKVTQSSLGFLARNLLHPLLKNRPGGVRQWKDPIRYNPRRPGGRPLNAPGNQSGVRTNVEPSQTSAGHGSPTASPPVNGSPTAVALTTLNSTEISMPYITLTPAATTSTLNSTLGASSSVTSVPAIATTAQGFAIGPVQPIQPTATFPTPAPVRPTPKAAALKFEECTPAWWSIRQSSWIIPPKGNHPNYCFYTDPTPFHRAAKDAGCLPNFRRRECRAKYFDRQIKGMSMGMPKTPTGLPKEWTEEWKLLHLGWWVKANGREAELLYVAGEEEG